MGPWTAPTPHWDRIPVAVAKTKLIMQFISPYIYDENISVWTNYLNINGDKEALLGDESSVHGDLCLEIEELCLKEGSISIC